MQSRPTFFSAPFLVEGIKGISLQFNDHPISRGIFKRFYAACLNDISFGEIDSAELRELMKRARVGGLDLLQAQSIRRHAIRQYNITNTHKIEHHIAQIAEAYDQGESILNISEKLKLSPYIIFRHLMFYLQSKGQRSEVKDKLNLLSLGKARAEDILDPRDAEQFLSVREFDFESIAVQLKIADVSQRRESNFIEFLRDELGISLKTQQQLFDEASKQEKLPVTPDALFTSPVKINGEEARWIDFKSYCGTPIPFLARNVKLQYDKYLKTFGPGFMVYEHGFVEPVSFPSVSARALRDIIENGVRHTVLV